MKPPDSCEKSETAGPHPWDHNERRLYPMPATAVTLRPYIYSPIFSSGSLMMIRGTTSSMRLLAATFSDRRRCILKYGTSDKMERSVDEFLAACPFGVDVSLRGVTLCCKEQCGLRLGSEGAARCCSPACTSANLSPIEILRGVAGPSRFSKASVPLATRNRTSTARSEDQSPIILSRKGIYLEPI